MMIVDDEYWVLEGIHCLLDWEKLGINIICEAGDGRSAIEKMTIYRPDIVLTDISMPIMDGLKLTEYIAENYPDCAVVIMSGYADFNYAQKAIKSGVTAFIIKPIDRDELESAVCQAIDTIYDRRALHCLHKRSDYELEDAKCWQTLKNGEILPEGGYMFVIEFDSFISVEIRDYMEQYLHNRCVCFIKTQDADRNFMGIVTSEQFPTLDTLRKLLRHMMAGIEISGNIVISKKLVARNGFDNQMQHIGLILDSIRGIEHGVMVYEEEFNQKRKLQTIPYTQAERLVQDVENTNEAAALADLEQMEDFIRSSLNYEHGLLLQHLLSGLDAVLQKYDMRIERLFANNIAIVSLLGLGMPREKVMLVLEDGIRRCIQYIQDQRTNTSGTTVRKVKEYIDVHYAEPMSLNQLATKYYIAPTHLSREFKRIVGMNLKRYIRQTRLHQAAILLLNTELKTAEISNRVGYDNPDYFMKLFREDYQMTPSAYRRVAKGKIIE